MAIVYVDGFEGAGDPWTGSGAHGYDYRRSGFLGLHMSGAEARRDLWIPNGPYYYTTVGFAFKLLSYDGFWDPDVLSFWDSENHHAFSLYMSPNAQLQLRVNDGLATPAHKTWVRQNKWYFLEIVFEDAPEGKADLYVNGQFEGSVPRYLNKTAQEIIDLEAVWRGVQILSFGPQWSSYAIDDFYIKSDENPLGDSSALLSFPEGAGSTAAWTPSTAPNWDCVNEVDPDGDTSYVETANAGDVDLYQMQDLPLSGTIHAVQVLFQAQKQSAGQRGVSARVKVGGNTATGPVSYPDALNYSFSFTGTFLLNPASQPWSVSDLNNLEAGIVSV